MAAAASASSLSCLEAEGEERGREGRREAPANKGAGGCGGGSTTRVATNEEVGLQALNPAAL